MEKDNILQRLDKAFRYLDQVVPQPGRSVDMLAEARREYRLLYAEISRGGPEQKKPLSETDKHEYRPTTKEAVPGGSDTEKGSDGHE